MRQSEISYFTLKQLGDIATKHVAIGTGILMYNNRRKLWEVIHPINRVFGGFDTEVDSCQKHKSRLRNLQEVLMWFSQWGDMMPIKVFDNYRELMNYHTP